MSMFQKSVLKNFTQNESLVAARFVAYQKFKEKLEFVKSVKEEKYQDGFLKEYTKAKKLKFANKLEGCNFKQEW